MFTKVELDHLLTLLRDSSQDDSYYGDRTRYRNRGERLWRKLQAEYNRAAKTDGYPLRPRTQRNDSREWPRHGRPCRHEIA